MKVILSLTILFAALFCSCNSNTSTDKKTKVSEDSLTTSLVNLSTVNTMSELLCQNWEDKADVEDGVLNGGGDLEIPFHGYSFFTDGLMVQDPRDKMKTGKWTLDEKTKNVTIIFDDKSKQQAHIQDIGVKNLLLKTGEKAAAQYIADGKNIKNLSDDPFYPVNNKWRLKPTKSENDAAIKQRIIDCVLFYSKFFKNNADHGYSSISFYGIPSCFKWYSGGISITNKDKLNARWIDCFYNKEQAVQGQQLLEKAITKKYNWNKTEPKWTKKSANVLLQMADTLRSL